MAITIDATPGFKHKTKYKISFWHKVFRKFGIIQKHSYRNASIIHEHKPAANGYNIFTVGMVCNICGAFSNTKFKTCKEYEAAKIMEKVLQ